MLSREERRQMKKSAWQVLKKHYFLLVILCVAAVYIGNEFTFTSTFLNYKASGEVEGSDSLRTEVRSRIEPFLNSTAGQVFLTILVGDYSAGATEANLAMESYRANSEGVLARSKGVLAALHNSIFSGHLFVTLAEALNSVFHSRRAVSIILILGSFLLYLAAFALIRNAYGAVLRRGLLEARLYERVPMTDLFHMGLSRRWFRGSLTLFVMYLFQNLLKLTVIGGVISYYTYFLVPFIVAENPDIRPLKALRLSRRMMKGHKRELFLFQLSYGGWYLLSALTLGISDFFLGTPLRMAGYAEYYADRRAKAKTEFLEGTELLDDTFLYEKAMDKTLRHAYRDLVEDRAFIRKNQVALKGWQKRAAEWFGLWLGREKDRKRYQEVEARKYLLGKGEDSLEQRTYPLRLNPLCGDNPRLRENAKNCFFLRCYTGYSLVLLFIAFSLIGWSWEVILHFIQAGEFVNRGTLHGPWLPIYGSGGVLVLLALNKLRGNPMAMLLGSMTLSGVVEYLTSFVLERKYGFRWWDYTGSFLNLNGRICAEGLILFGVGCLAIVYLLSPWLDDKITRIRKEILVPLSLSLAALFLADAIYSSVYPNMGRGVTEERLEAEQECEFCSDFGAA